MKFELVLRHWDLFASGIWVTLHLTALALIFGMLIALPASLSLARRGRFSPLIRGYVYVFRGTPLLVQTYLIYYGLSQFEFVRDSVAWPMPFSEACQIAWFLSSFWIPVDDITS